MANQIVEQQAAEFAVAGTRIYEAAYRDGRIAGRREALEQLRYVFDKFDEAFPIEPPAAKRPRTPSAVPFGAITGTVKAALEHLEATNPEGADPSAIADYLKTRNDHGGPPLDIHQVRAGLKQLTATGAARRISRGRYLPNPPANEPAAETPVQAAAE